MKPISFENWKEAKEEGRRIAEWKVKRTAELKAKIQELVLTTYRHVEKIKSHDDVWSRCARKLTDRPVVVRHRIPATPHSGGLYHKDSDGVSYIDLHPELPLWPKLEIFLHECGHCVVEHDTMPQTEVYKVDPLSMDIPPMSSEEEARWEDPADELRDLWLMLVERVLREQPELTVEQLLAELGKLGAQYTERLQAAYSQSGGRQ